MGENSIINNIFPVLSLLQCFGLCPLYHGRRDIGSGWKVVRILYSLLLYISFLYYILQFYVYRLYNVFYSKLSIFLLMYFIENLNELECFVCFPILYWHWSAHLSSYIDLWSQLQEEVEKICKKKVSIHAINRTLSEIFSKITALVFAMLLTSYFFVLPETRIFYTYGLTILLCVTTFLWTRICDMLYGLGKHLETFILVSKDIEMSNMQFDMLLMRWIRICQLLKSSNDVYSHLLFLAVQSLTMLAMFNSFTILTYVVIRKTEKYEYFHSAVILVFAAWNVYLICDTSHRTTKQVHFMVQKQIIVSNLFYLNCEKLIKIRKLLHINSIVSPSISIYKLTKINRQLLVNLTLSTATYLMVLVQFQMTTRDTSTSSNAIDHRSAVNVSKSGRTA